MTGPSGSINVTTGSCGGESTPRFGLSISAPLDKRNRSTGSSQPANQLPRCAHLERELVCPSVGGRFRLRDTHLRDTQSHDQEFQVRGPLLGLCAVSPSHESTKFPRVTTRKRIPCDTSENLTRFNTPFGLGQTVGKSSRLFKWRLAFMGPDFRESWGPRIAAVTHFRLQSSVTDCRF